jgi:uncharacterized protein YoxC
LPAPWGTLPGGLVMQEGQSMNFVGKILVVLIFVMSLVFMSFAVMVYATHKNWKEVVTRTQAEVKPGEQLGLKYQLDGVKKENDELQDRIEKLESDKKKELQDKADALVKLETEKAALSTENQQLITERDALSKKEKEAVAALDTSSQNLKKLTEEVGVLRDQIRGAQEDRDSQFSKVVTLTDEVHKAQQSISRLSERERQLAAQVAAARALLAFHGEDINSPIDKRAPSMRGKVLAVNDQKMVEVDLGSDDGLRVGHKLEVFRGAKYIGRVVVLSTATDKSVAKVDVDYTRVPVMRGDDVATRLRASATPEQAAVR